MQLELITEERTAQLRLVHHDGNQITIMVDDVLYILDVVKVGKGNYSILLDGESYNLELVEGANSREYTINTFHKTFKVEVIDAETRYRRKKGSVNVGSDKTVRSPMPGKVIRILVSKGEQVVKGQTVIIVSAMKMESEFKATVDGVVTGIQVSEGDVVDTQQVLVVIE